MRGEKSKILDENGNVKYQANSTLVNRRRYTTTIDLQLFAEAKDLSIKYEMQFSKLLDEALALYIKTEKKKEKRKNKNNNNNNNNNNDNQKDLVAI